MAVAHPHNGMAVKPPRIKYTLTKRHPSDKLGYRNGKLTYGGSAPKRVSRLVLFRFTFRARFLTTCEHSGWTAPIATPHAVATTARKANAGHEKRGIYTDIDIVHGFQGSEIQCVCVSQYHHSENKDVADCASRFDHR